MSTAVVKADVKGVVEQVQEIQQLMAEVMKPEVHYGTIPGCGDKPTLLKPGAEKICLLFHIAPEYKIEKTELPGDHREYMIVCRLTNRSTGEFLGEGVGICTTMEKKYRYRNATRKCPACGEPKIIPGKPEYGGGWVCWSKDGTACKAKFDKDDPEIINQEVGKVDNPDIADTYNTVLKIGKKRALVDATLTATAASDIFTQDLEDIVIEPQVVEAEIVEEPKSEPDRKVAVAQGYKISDILTWENNEKFTNSLTLPFTKSLNHFLTSIRGEHIPNLPYKEMEIDELSGLFSDDQLEVLDSWHLSIGKKFKAWEAKQNEK